MARTLNEIPVGMDKRTTRATKYPWDQWLNGDLWELTQGEDFTVSTTSMTSAATLYAMRRGIKVNTTQRGRHVYVQAIGVNGG